VAGEPLKINFADARVVRYTREENGLDGVSRRMVQRSDGLPYGVHHATVQPPADYGGTLEEDAVIYALDGSSRATVADQDFELGPGDALVVPKGSRYRIVHSDNPQTTLIFLTPAPSEGKHH
jgi:mannose-6-phosphate isomerase-like protein (cupin superfamily)